MAKVLPFERSPSRRPEPLSPDEERGVLLDIDRAVQLVLDERNRLWVGLFEDVQSEPPAPTDISSA